MKQPQGNNTSESGVSIGVQLLTAGTAACIADFATFPLDTAKVRLQIQGEAVATTNTATVSRTPLVTNANFRLPLAMATPNGAFITTETGFTTATAAQPQYRGLVGTIATIIRQEGPRALYNGLAAGLQRQMVFASVRLGTYDSVKAMYQKLFNERRDSLQLITRISAGLTTGGLAVIIGQPTDLVKVRYQCAKREIGGKPRYASTLAAYKSIGREEGIRGLWKGAMPNIGRNAVVNVAEIVCYDVVKSLLLTRGQMRDNIYCHFTSAVIAGFATTVAASPVDVVKTRYMNARPGQYAGAIDCAVRMATQEGAQAFYKGFVPSFVRIVSWNVCLWITYEQIKKLVFKPKVNHDDY